MNAISLAPLVRSPARRAGANLLPQHGVLASVAALAGLVIVGAELAAGLSEDPKPLVNPPPTNAPTTAEHNDHEGFPLPAEALARVGSARLRHGRRTMNLAYSPDGKLLASSDGGLLRLWDARTGKPLWSVRTAGNQTALNVPGVFAPDGKTILVLERQTCRWFDVATGREVRRCDVPFPKSPKWGNWSCCTPHGETLVGTATDGATELLVYDLLSGKERLRKNTDHQLLTLGISPDGRMLAARSPEDGPGQVIKFFDLRDGTLQGNISPALAPYRLTFAPDGTKLLGVNLLDRLMVWSVPDGRLLLESELPGSFPTTAIFTPDGKAVLLGSQSRPAVLLDLANGKELRRFPLCVGCSAFTFTPDGKTVAMSLGSGAISQWDVATDKPVASCADPITHFSYLQFDDQLLWTWSETLTAFDWRSGRVVERRQVPHESLSQVATVSPDRARVAGVNAARQLAVWDSASGRELCIIPVPQGGNTVRTFAPDGKTLFTSEWDGFFAGRGGAVRAWDAATGKELSPIDAGPHKTHALVVSPDGRWLASAEHPWTMGGAREETTVWDLTSRRVAHRLVPQPGSGGAWGLAFSPDSSHLATVGDGFIVVCDLATGKERWKRAEPNLQATKVAYSADGRMLAVGGRNGEVSLWEVASGQERHRFIGHESEILGLAFSPDGRLLAAASADAPLFIWDVTGS